MLMRSPMKRTSRNTGPSSATREALAERSGGRCEMALHGCTGQATEVAHRIARKAGGRHGAALEESNRLSNLIHSCRDCHRWTHHRPAEAVDLGLMLREWDVPVIYAMQYRAADWVHLHDDGTVELCSCDPS